MINQLMELLQSNDWKNTGSEVIEIAKGKYELPTTLKGAKLKLKRQWQSRK